LLFIDRSHDVVAGPTVVRSGTLWAPMDGSMVDV
jgi:hypothetical protein